MEYSVVNAGGASYIGQRVAHGSVFRGIKYANAARFELPVEATPAGRVDATRFGKCCPQKRAYFDEKYESDTFYYNEFRRGVDFEYDENCQYLNIYTPCAFDGKETLSAAQDGNGDEGDSVDVPSAAYESGSDAGDEAIAHGDNSNAQSAANDLKAPVVLFVHGGSFTGGSSDEKQLDGSTFAARGAVFVSVNYRLNVFGFFAGSRAVGNYGLYDVACALDFVRRHIADFGGDPDNITLMGQSAGAMLITTLISSGMVEGKAKRAILLSGGGVRRLLLPLRRPDRKFWDDVGREAERFGKPLDKADAQALYKAWASHSGMRSLFATAPVIDGVGVKDDDYAAHTLPCIIGMVGRDIMPPVLRKMRYRYAKLLAEQGKGCYAYDFLHPLPGDDRGTFHSADLWYALGTLDNSDRPFGTADRAISEAMMTRLFAFMRTDSPNPAGYTEWRRFVEKGDILRIL